jgi:uncharacterized protein (TIGR02266 family)
MATAPGLLTVRLPWSTAEQFLQRAGPTLTRGGLFLTGEEARPPGTPLVLELQLDDGTHLLKAQAVVAWVTGARGEGVPGMGLQFVAVDAPGRRFLEAAAGAMPHARSRAPPVPQGVGIPDVRPGALTPAPARAPAGPASSSRTPAPGGGGVPGARSDLRTPAVGAPAPGRAAARTPGTERLASSPSGLASSPSGLASSPSGLASSPSGLASSPSGLSSSPSGLAPGTSPPPGRLEALPHAIGLALPGGHFHVVIPRGTALPARRTFRVNTTRDRQERLELTVLQGESSRARDDAWLGRFVVDGLPPAPRGGLTVELDFELDEVCLLTLTGTDSVSGRQVSARFATRDTPAEVRDALHAHQRGAGGGEAPQARGSWISRLLGT